MHAVRDGDARTDGRRNADIQLPLGAAGASNASATTFSSASASSPGPCLHRAAASPESDSCCAASPSSALHHGVQHDSNEPASKRARVGASPNSDASSSAQSPTALAAGNNHRAGARVPIHFPDAAGALQDDTVEPDAPPRVLTAAEVAELGEKV